MKGATVCQQPAFVVRQGEWLFEPLEFKLTKFVRILMFMHQIQEFAGGSDNEYCHTCNDQRSHEYQEKLQENLGLETKTQCYIGKHYEYHLAGKFY
ncbi:MAG: hypothetical protein M3Y81_06925 [Chloroflexota bacterium]|nr:hypothetical protein [Chloroflexota bacterium]